MQQYIKLLLMASLLSYYNCSPHKKPEKDNTEPSTQPLIADFREGYIKIKKPDGKFEETTNREDWVITPNKCQLWDYKTFGNEMQQPPLIGHKQSGGTGVLPYAIDGLLNLAGGEGSLDTIIISTGVHEYLGVSPEAKGYLKDLKQRQKIKDYYIVNSKAVPELHNKCVRKGQRVGTLLHTTC